MLQFPSMATLRVATQVHRITVFINLLAIAVCVFLAVSLYDNWWRNVLIFSFNDVLSLFFGASALYLCGLMLWRPRVEIVANQVNVRYFLGLIHRKFILSDIAYWYILSKSKANERLLLYTADHRRLLTLQREHIANFPELVSCLTHNKKHNQVQGRLHRLRLLRFAAYISLLLVILGIGWAIYLFTYRPIQTADLSTVRGNLRVPAVWMPAGKQYYMEFQLDEYANWFKVNVGRDTTYSLEELNRDFGQSQEVALQVEATHKQARLKQRKAVDSPLAERFYRPVEVVYLTMGNTQYGEVKSFNAFNQRTHLIGGFGACFLAVVSGFVSWRLRRYFR